MCIKQLCPLSAPTTGFLEGEKRHSHTLKAGRHLFPFQLQLGGSLPSSIATTAHGGVSRPWKVVVVDNHFDCIGGLDLCLAAGTHTTVSWQTSIQRISRLFSSLGKTTTMPVSSISRTLETTSVMWFRFWRPLGCLSMTWVSVYCPSGAWF